MIKVRLVSLIRSRASWAHVARKLCEAMQQMGVLVMIEEDDDGIINSQLDIGEGVKRALNTRFPDPDVDLLIVRPERFQHYGKAPVRTAYMVFEADRWPEDWVALGTKNLELVLDSLNVLPRWPDRLGHARRSDRHPAARGRSCILWTDAAALR